jgi:hypothetical protein
MHQEWFTTSLIVEDEKEMRIEGNVIDWMEES